MLPSYIAGALIVLLVYWHGQLWRGSGVGLIAAMLTAFNPHLLIQMKEASPATLAIAATLTSLYAYGRHFRVGAWRASRFDLGSGGTLCVILGGLALGLSLLSIGLVGLFCVPVVVFHSSTCDRTWRLPSVILARGTAGGTTRACWPARSRS